MKIYLIGRGLRSCSDCDEIKGFFHNEAEAEAYADARQAEETEGMWWWVAEVDQLNG